MYLQFNCVPFLPRVAAVLACLLNLFHYQAMHTINDNQQLISSVLICGIREKSISRISSRSRIFPPLLLASI